jgi:hypothetical protein
MKRGPGTALPGATVLALVMVAALVLRPVPQTAGSLSFQSHRIAGIAAATPDDAAEPVHRGPGAEPAHAGDSSGVPRRTGDRVEAGVGEEPAADSGATVPETKIARAVQVSPGQVEIHWVTLGGPVVEIELWARLPGAKEFTLAETLPGGMFRYQVAAGAGEYHFHVRAHDPDGNYEDAPAEPDATLMVAGA